MKLVIYPIFSHDIPDTPIYHVKLTTVCWSYHVISNLTIFNPIKTRNLRRVTRFFTFFTRLFGLRVIPAAPSAASGWTSRSGYCSSGANAATQDPGPHRYGPMAGPSWSGDLGIFHDFWFDIILILIRIN